MKHLKATLLGVAISCLALSCFAQSGCTLNVSAIDREISAASATATRVEVDLVPIEDRIPRTELTITGADRSDATATALLQGLRGSGTDLDALLLLWSIGFSARGADAVGLDLGAPDSTSEIWLEALDIEVPADADVTVNLESLSLLATNLTGRIDATATSGSLEVETTGAVDLEATSGSIDVIHALAGSMHTTSGSIRVDLASWITASATSGSIDGVIGDGGTGTATSGSIALTLRRALTRDLTLSTTSGSVVLEVPPGAPMHLDLMSESGDVHVNTGGVDYDGSEYVGEVSGGGPTLHIRASSGSIHVRESR